MVDNNKVVVELGRVIKNRGEYNPDASPLVKYFEENIVQKQGSSYIAYPTALVNDGVLDGKYYLTRAPYNDDPQTPNAGWEVFASGKHNFKTGEDIEDVSIATGSDFTNPDVTKRAKVPTVGAVLDGLNDGVYDVSKRNPTAGPNNDGKFTLDYILSNADTLIPTGWRHGGMIISFVDSSDNKYVQYRFMLSEFTAAQFANATNWQGVDDEPIAESNSLVKSGGVVKHLTDNIGYTANQENWALVGNCSISGRGGWDVGNTYESKSFDVTELHGSKLVVIANNIGNAIISFVRSIGYPSNPVFATGETGRHVIPVSTSAELIVPVDANYAVVTTKNDNQDRTPLIYGEFAQFEFIKHAFNNTDSEPTTESGNLVKSGGVAKTVYGIEQIKLTGGAPSILADGSPFVNEDYEGTEIEVKAGDVLYWSCNVNNSQAAISLKVDNTYTVLQIGKTNSAPWGSIYNYQQLFLEDGVVNITYNKTRFYSYCIRAKYFDYKNHDLWKSVKPIIEPVEIVDNIGYLSYPNGTTIETPSGTTNRYAEVNLKAGDKLFWSCKIASIACALFADGSSVGTYKPLVQGQGWQNYGNYSYEAVTDTKVYIGYIKDANATIYASVIKCFNSIEYDKTLYNKEIPQQTIKNGYYNTSSGWISSNSFTSILYKVNPNEAFYVKGQESSSIALVAFYADDTMGTPISVINGTGTYDDFIFPPQGTNYMLLYKAYEVRGKGSNNVINCIGDSLTQGQDGLSNPREDIINSLNCYVDELKQYLPDHHCLNYGYGGNNPSAILVSCGLSEMVINKDWVLSSANAQIGNQTQDELVDEFIGNNFKGGYMNQGRTFEAIEGRKRGKLHGYTVTIQKSSSSGNNTIYVYASNSSLSIPIKSGDTIQANGIRNRDGISVLFMGRNDSAWYFDSDTCVKDYKNIVSALNNDKFLIIGLYTASADEKASVLATNNALRKAFGNKFVDLNRFLCSDTPFKVLSYTKTVDSDISAERQAAGVYSDQYGIDNNLLPSSFWRYSKTSANNVIDNIHLNALGYKAIAYIIQNRIKFFGW